MLPVYDLGLDVQGQPFFTMKLVRGHQTLADVITALRIDEEAHRRYTFQRRVSVIQQVSMAACLVLLIAVAILWALL